MNVIHRLISSDDQLNIPQGGFFTRVSGSARTSGRELSLGAGASVSTLTYYNAFSISKWRRHTDLSDLSLRLLGEGKIMVDVLTATVPLPETPLLDLERAFAIPATEETLLTSITLDLKGTEQIACELDVRELSGEMLFFRITAGSEVTLTDLVLVTDTEPMREPKLGIVITHFNRQEALAKATERLETAFAQSEQLATSAKVFVVDNSDNCGLDNSAHRTIIPNENYGGAGGFSRGLLELVENDSYTHALFMDDDASCHPESIARTLSFLSYTKSPKLAVAGTLLQEEDHSTVYESGAYFDGICHRIHKNLNIINSTQVILNEREGFKPNYGGWWFFAFDIREISHFPFPFFVRGDDVAFSITNHLQVVCLNGVAAFGETFESKHSAMTAYLDTRAHIVQQLAVLGHSRYAVLRGCLRFFVISLFSYRYGSAAAVCLALEDLLAGPDFFANNLSMSARLPVLKELSRGDYSVKLEESPRNMAIYTFETDRLPRKLLRLATMNGFLLPDFLLRKNPVFQKPGFKARFSQVFGHQSIYYSDSTASSGELAVIDRKRMLGLAFRFGKIFAAILWNFVTLTKIYKEEFGALASKKFWASVYGLNR
ncbi:glycosyltransferase [Parahalioglobus pacificus]|uniref:Glycosyl transferase n=1 Tax=Parahalioglobus pacificus TaxID=930806 RepID=A0A919CKA9_9GAMM|nr:glycosyltransferase [Halioglobus pacificus]GHD33690.1 glycosyl transferase [Halioglobus pacificus]